MTVPPSEGAEEAQSRARELQLRLLGGPPTMDRRDVARSVGVSLLSVRKLWRALGFASVPDDEVAFTEGDQEALERVITIVRRGLLDEEAVIACARALGQTTDRLVTWHSEVLAEYIERASGEGERSLQAFLAHAESMGPLDEVLSELEFMLVYSWRRQIAAAFERMSEGSTAAEGAASAELTVAFADLVSYTRLSRSLTQRDLGVLVQRFEGLASDIVTAGGGRLVKTVGDEVLFTADTPAAAAVIALSMSELLAEDDVVPDVRIGLVHGPVLRSLGDVYGSTVNMASRLTSLAQPGTVLTDPRTAQLLDVHPEFTLVPQRRRQVAGFGTFTPLLLARAGTYHDVVPLDIF